MQKVLIKENIMFIHQEQKMGKIILYCPCKKKVIIWVFKVMQPKSLKISKEYLISSLEMSLIKENSKRKEKP